MWGLLCSGKTAGASCSWLKIRVVSISHFFCFYTKVVITWNTQSSSLPCYLYRAAGASFSDWTGWGVVYLTLYWWGYWWGWGCWPSQCWDLGCFHLYWSCWLSFHYMSPAQQWEGIFQPWEFKLRAWAAEKPLVCLAAVAGVQMWPDPVPHVCHNRCASTALTCPPWQETWWGWLWHGWECHEPQRKAEWAKSCSTGSLGRDCMAVSAPYPQGRLLWARWVLEWWQPDCSCFTHLGWLPCHTV